LVINVLFLLKFITDVPKNGQFQDIIDQLANNYAIKSSDFRIFKVIKGKIVKNYTLKCIIDTFEDDGCFVMYVLFYFSTKFTIKL
jgi:hypothetical protein